VKRAAAFASVLLLCSCTGASAPHTAVPTGGAVRIPGPIIRVASFDFPESVLLAELYGRALRSRGYPVKIELSVGSREIVEPALQQGLVDFVPEYLGSAVEFEALGNEHPGPNVGAATAQLTRLMSAHGVTVLQPAPAEDQNAVVVTAATAQTHSLRTVSDLAPIASQMKFGGPPECPQRPFCLLGLHRVYGLSFEAFVPLDAGGPYTVHALARGDVQAAMLFSTDGAIPAMAFTVLRDDRGLQQAENVVPVVRDSVVHAYGPGMAATVDTVSRRLTTHELTALNLQVATGRSPAAVAAAWLTEHGLGD